MANPRPSKPHFRKVENGLWELVSPVPIPPKLHEFYWAHSPHSAYFYWRHDVRDAVSKGLMCPHFYIGPWSDDCPDCRH